MLFNLDWNLVVKILSERYFKVMKTLPAIVQIRVHCHQAFQIKKTQYPKKERSTLQGATYSFYLVPAYIAGIGES